MLFSAFPRISHFCRKYISNLQLVFSQFAPETNSLSSSVTKQTNYNFVGSAVHCGEIYVG